MQAWVRTMQTTAPAVCQSQALLQPSLMKRHVCFVRQYDAELPVSLHANKSGFEPVDQSFMKSVIASRH
jgi:hypothetical protein